MRIAAVADLHFSPQSYDRIGKNLIVHLRSNLSIRVPRAAIAANLPPTVIPSLQVSALLVKGKAANGRTYHFQITASMSALMPDGAAMPSPLVLAAV